MLVHDNEYFPASFKVKLKLAVEKKRPKVLDDKEIFTVDHNIYENFLPISGYKYSFSAGTRFVKGCRFNDDQRIVYLACGIICEQLIKTLGEEIIMEQALAIANSLTTKDIEKLAVIALLESAVCDYYYQYEKTY